MSGDEPNPFFHRRNPSLWFFAFLGLTILLGLAAYLLDGPSQKAAVGFGYAAVGAFMAAVAAALVSVGITFWRWLLSLRTAQGRTQAALFLGWRAVLVVTSLGAITLFHEYTKGTALLEVPWIGQGIVTGRLRDWPKALGEEERDVTVERCQRAERGFLCFLKKLDPDGTYRTIPCYFDGSTPDKLGKKLRAAGVKIEAFCSKPF